MGNIWQTMHCRAFILMSNKIHMDVHLWIERTPLNLPNIILFWIRVLCSEAMKCSYLHIISHKFDPM